MSRKKKLILNTIFSIFNQLVNIISGFILPSNMIRYYGSDINGLISSITQFLGFISFMQLGIGVVIQASWYKPLSEQDEVQTSKVYSSAEKFFRKIAVIFLVYIIVLVIIYPEFIKVDESRMFIVMLIIILSCSLFAQYFWGLTNSLLLQSDQKGYIPQILSSIVTILNVVICVWFIRHNYSVLIVKTLSMLVNLINPIFLTLYVKKNYHINKKIQYEEEPIKQKWSGFAQHISAVVVDNTDIVVLTLFSTLNSVSVYYVYHMVVNGIKLLLTSITGGIQSLFGNMIARKETELLKKTFEYFELCFSFITTLLYSLTLCLIVPFIKVYTYGIADVNYNEPVFAVVLTLAYAMFCYRTIFYTLIKAAGHFKETQKGALFEAVINVTVSMICVRKLGIVGVAIGTLIAMFYRTVYCVWYLRKRIIYRKMRLFLKNIILNTVVFFICYSITKFMHLENISYLSWVLLAVKECLICIGICSLGYLLVYIRKILEIKEFIETIAVFRSKRA